MHHAGPDVQDVFSTVPDTGNADNYNAAVTALNAYFVPRVNAAYARQSFYKLSQNSGETVQQFATHLRQAAKDCAFAGDMNNQIRDAVIGKCSSAYAHQHICTVNFWKKDLISHLIARWRLLLSVNGGRNRCLHHR